MVDFVAFDKHLNTSYSIYDVLERNNDMKKEEQEYYCLCGDKVYAKNESIVFVNRKGRQIQRRCHFAHYKNSKCVIKKAYNSIDYLDEEEEENSKIDDAPEKTEEYKRYEILFEILYNYRKSKKLKIEAKKLIEEALKYCDKYKIEYTITDYIYNIIDNKTIGIGFKDIEYKDIELNNNIYTIIELETDIYDKALPIGYISNSCIRKISNNFELFKIFVKKLSIMSLFASRCINYDKIYNQVNNFIDEIEKKLYQKCIKGEIRGFQIILERLVKSKGKNS